MADRTKIALFVDADNVSPKIIPAIMDELTASYGEVTYRRAYRNWAIQSTEWQDVVARYSMQPIYQANNVKGKNSADIKLIIDAMDALYAGAADCFCIVSSDSDFTALAMRLRESGKDVIGIGAHDKVKDDSALARACTKFIFIENLVDDHDVDTFSEDIEQVIAEIILANGTSDGKMNLSALKEAIVSRQPDFDTRSFGFSSFAKFCASFKSLEVVPAGAPSDVALIGVELRTAQIMKLIQDFVKEAGKKGRTLPEIGAEINEQYPGQSIRALGYTRMEKLLGDVEGVAVKQRRGGAKVAVWQPASA